MVDCTPVVEGLVEHSFFINSPSVVEDMRKVLVGTPSDGIEGRDYVPETNRYRLKEDPAVCGSALRCRVAAEFRYRICERIQRIAHIR